MIQLSLLSLAALLAGARSVVPPPPVTDEYARIIVRSHVVVRVRTAPATPLKNLYREKKGPQCIAMADMAGAAIIAPNSVDLVLRTGKRMRARFASSCPALDYYSGFYIAPSGDGKFCAGRDAIRDRAGGECAVQRIRELSPRK